MGIEVVGISRDLAPAQQKFKETVNAKNTFLTERVGLQFRTEIFNLFNRVQFNPPGLALGNAQFGVVSGQYNTPRLVQFALRLQF